MAGPIRLNQATKHPTPSGSRSLDSQLTFIHAPQPLSPEQFATLFREHARTLWCIAAAVLGDREQARDVVQDASIVGLGKLNEFSPGSSFVHWMGQIVRFTALNEARRKRPRAADVHALPLAGASHNANAQPEFDARTRQALSQLDETARTCLLMRTVLDMSYRHISEALGIAESTAMSHVHRSRLRLREALSGKEVGTDD